MKSLNKFLQIITALLVLLTGEVFAQLGVGNNAPEVSIVSPSVEGIYKGDSLRYILRLNVATDRNTSVTLEIREQGSDLIDAQYEGIQTIVIPANSIQTTQTIPTNNVAPGNRLVFSRVNLLIGAPQGESIYRIGEPATLSLAIVERECGHAVDADVDDDGLIEICDLEDLDAIRYSLDGSGYKASLTAPLLNLGCDEDGDDGGVCRGYELTKNLNFSDPSDYRSGRINSEWAEGIGWQPIGTRLQGFSGYFEANGFTISNLHINRPINTIGLFGRTEPSARINALTLIRVNIRGRSEVGSLVAINEGIVSNVNIVNGRVVGSVGTVGGLIGVNRGTVLATNILLDTVAAGISERRCRDNLRSNRCADAEQVETVIQDGDIVGGLIGDNDGNVSDSFVSTNVRGAEHLGGLVGLNSGRLFEGNDARGSVNGNSYAGGLVGNNVGGSITANRSNADVMVFGNYAGGLVGYACSRKTDSRECVLPNEDIDSALQTRISDSSADGNVVGNNYIGGLVGNAQKIIITRSHANGSVSGRDWGYWWSGRI